MMSFREWYTVFGNSEKTLHIVNLNCLQEVTSILNDILGLGRRLPDCPYSVHERGTKPSKLVQD